jgi:hypothetical protein
MMAQQGRNIGKPVMTTEWKVQSAEVMMSCVSIHWTRECEGLTQDLFAFVNTDNSVNLYAKETWEGRSREYKLNESRQYIMDQKEISAAFFRSILAGEKQC